MARLGRGYPAEWQLLQALDAAGHTIVIGTATETDTALPITRLKAKAISIAAETDSAIALTRNKARAIGIAAETDSAIALGRNKAKLLGLASETDSAQPITIAGGTITLGIALEIDAAIAIGRLKAKAIAIATETDSAIVLGRKKSRVLGIALETDTAIHVTNNPIRRLITPATETDLALTIVASLSSGAGAVLDLGGHFPRGGARFEWFERRIRVRKRLEREEVVEEVVEAVLAEIEELPTDPSPPQLAAAIARIVSTLGPSWEERYHAILESEIRPVLKAAAADELTDSEVAAIVLLLLT